MKIAVVICTFNRLNCLKIALHKYENQSVLPDYMVIVDNASTDGTKEYLEKWKNNNSLSSNLIIVHMIKNMGGSGGFSKGIKIATRLDCDYIFLADDDAYPEVDTFKKLKKAEAYCNKNKLNVAALCTSVYNGNQPDYFHRCYIKKGLLGLKFVGEPKRKYKTKIFKIDILTFVGACIKKSIIKKIGNVKSQYFIYFDDSDYSLRIERFGNIYCVPGSVMHHDVGYDRRSSWKDYYDTRNRIDLVKNNFSRRYLYATVIRMYLKRCSILAKIFRGRTIAHRRMCMTAIKDGLNGNLGLNSIYKPGTKI